MKAELKIEFELETDGRWIAEVIALPGALAYGSTRGEAQRKAETLAQEVLFEIRGNKELD
jgi:predicted RNase H-like HicB family nuclease